MNSTEQARPLKVEVFANYIVIGGGNSHEYEDLAALITEALNVKAETGFSPRQLVEGMWHVVTVTHGGTVSILKNLSKDVAEETAKRLDPWGGPAMPGETRHMTLTNGTIRHIHVLGPREASEPPVADSKPDLGTKP